MPYNVKDLIPHRDGMLLVGEILSHVNNESIHAQSEFPENHHVFEGHFPGNPIMPGMLTLEMMAQTAACLASLTLGLKQENVVYYFLSVEKAKFRKMVLPNQKLDIFIKAIKIRGKLCKFEGEVKFGDEVVAESIFTAMIDEKE